MKLTGPPVLKTTLRVDAMYLHAARANFDHALKQEVRIDKAWRGVARLNTRADRILEKYDGDDMKAYDELEPVYIQLEDAEYRLGKAYGPQLQSLASVHILAAAALESHINSRAAEKLKQGLFRLVERFSLEAKWVTVPRLLGLLGFDLGAEPYQSFARLVRYRNGLIHFKPHVEDWKAPGVPAFLRDLGLTKEASETTLKAAAAMIAQLAKQSGEKNPSWLGRNATNYFDFTVE